MTSEVLIIAVTLSSVVGVTVVGAVLFIRKQLAEMTKLIRIMRITKSEFDGSLVRARRQKTSALMRQIKD